MHDYCRWGRSGWLIWMGRWKDPDSMLKTERRGWPACVSDLGLARFRMPVLHLISRVTSDLTPLISGVGRITGEHAILPLSHHLDFSNLQNILPTSMTLTSSLSPEIQFHAYNDRFDPDHLEILSLLWHSVIQDQMTLGKDRKTSTMVLTPRIKTRKKITSTFQDPFYWGMFYIWSKVPVLIVPSGEFWQIQPFSPPQQSR